MAISDSSYSASFSIPTPKGVYQADGDSNIAINYAYDARNIRTEENLLASAYGTRRAFPSLSARVETLERFYRRQHDGNPRADQFYMPEVWIAAAGGHVYAYLRKRSQGFTIGPEPVIPETPDSAGKPPAAWQVCPVVDKAGSTTNITFKSNKWACVTFEAVHYKDGKYTTDVLIMSNDQDGMYVLWGDTLQMEHCTVWTDGEHTDSEVPGVAGDDHDQLGNEHREVKFSTLCRYNERIWGTGDPNYPDRLFYSKPYDPLDWSDLGLQDTPELGGGNIDQPTWDGDKFIALVPYGNYMLACKTRTVFEIRGTDPSTFTFNTAFGSDAPLEARTICADGTYLYFLTRAGLGVYDGTSTRMLARDALCKTLAHIDYDRIGLATACIRNHVYTLALRTMTQTDLEWTPEEGEPWELYVRRLCNNVIVEYDTLRRTFMLRDGLNVVDFYAIDGTIYCTLFDAPYEIMVYNAEGENNYSHEPIHSHWETAWLDLGKTFRKKDFVVRFTAESQYEDCPITVILQTDRREKSRIVLLHKDRRDYRIPIQMTGRRVKLIIRANRMQSWWAIHGGVQIDYTYDEE